MIVVNTETATKHMITILKAGLVTMLSGKPGIGKSDIVHNIANNYNLELVDIRLSQCDPSDLNS